MARVTGQRGRLGWRELRGLLNEEPLLAFLVTSGVQGWGSSRTSAWLCEADERARRRAGLGPWAGSPGGLSPGHSGQTGLQGWAGQVGKNPPSGTQKRLVSLLAVVGKLP